jgi:outer membrane protein
MPGMIAKAAAFVVSLIAGAATAGPIGLLDAVRHTLAKNPDIQLQGKQVESSRGVLQQATGVFDPALHLTAGRSTDNSPLSRNDRGSFAAQGFSLSQITTKNTNYSLALDNPLRNGIVLSPRLSATRIDSTNNDIGNLPALTRGTVSFNILVPVLRNSGAAAAASESAAHLEWEATKQDLRFVVARGVLATVSSYWNLVAARKNLEVAIEGEASVRQMVAETRKLIEADEIPAADLNLVKANLLDRTASRITAEQALLDARQRLAQAIGLAYADVATLEPADEFPPRNSEPPVAQDAQARLVEMAMQRRADLAAARLREDSARALTSAARNNLKPQLDVNAAVGYAGLAEGNSNSQLANALGQNLGRANVGVSLSYQWPFDNNIARGRYLQQSALYDQSTIRIASVERTIGLGVESALSSVVRSAMQVVESEQTVGLYRITLENERMKHKLGSATLIDILSVNDRLLNARLGNISFRLNYLNALARLNFETGALLADDASGQSISMHSLVSMPEVTLTPSFSPASGRGELREGGSGHGR